MSWNFLFCPLSIIKRSTCLPCPPSGATSGRYQIHIIPANFPKLKFHYWNQFLPDEQCLRISIVTVVMERWAGKVAVVTGASSGIGAAIAKDLAKAGMVVIGLARRVERVEALKSDLPESVRSQFHTIKCDVSKEEDILQTFNWIEKSFGGVDVMINNAGVQRPTDLLEEGNTQMLREVLDTNVMGLVICSREAYQSMKKRSVDGHIVNINSIAGHKVVDMPQLNIYPASKHAVTAITETMRNELKAAGTKIKVTSISPGVVDTEILPDGIKVGECPLLEPEDISNAVLYVLGTPPRVQIHELVIKPVGENF